MPELTESTIAVGKHGRCRYIQSLESKWLNPDLFVVTVEAEPTKRFDRPQLIKLYLQRSEALSLLASLSQSPPSKEQS